MSNDDAAQFYPRIQDRAVVIGPSGSGKSELSRAILANYPNVVVIDPIGDWSWGTLGRADPKRYRYVARTLPALHKLLNEVARGGRGEPITFQPHWSLISSGKIDVVPRWALDRKDTLLFYDELENCVRSGDWEYKSPNFAAAIMQGRHKRVGVWCALKSPTQIPLVILRNCNVRYVFWLSDVANDRARAEEICGAHLPWEELAEEPFSWIYSNGRTVIGPMRLPGPV